MEELKPNASLGKGKLRAVVDLQMMKAELSQLEDPPVTPWEKELSSGRLQYEFFDVPCEELAQRLLGLQGIQLLSYNSLYLKNFLFTLKECDNYLKSILWLLSIILSYKLYILLILYISY